MAIFAFKNLFRTTPRIFIEGFAERKKLKKEGAGARERVRETKISNQICRGRMIQMFRRTRGRREGVPVRLIPTTAFRIMSEFSV